MALAPRSRGMRATVPVGSNDSTNNARLNSKECCSQCPGAFLKLIASEFMSIATICGRKCVAKFAHECWWSGRPDKFFAQFQVSQLSLHDGFGTGYPFAGKLPPVDGLDNAYHKTIHTIYLICQLGQIGKRRHRPCSQTVAETDADRLKKEYRCGAEDFNFSPCGYAPTRSPPSRCRAAAPCRSWSAGE